MSAPTGIAEWFVLVVSCLVIALTPVLLFRHWRNNENKGAWTATALWYKQDAYRQGHLRATPAVCLAGFSIALFTVAAFFAIPSVPYGEINWPLSYAGAVLAIALLASFIWYWVVMLFNRPKFLVAPHLRQQPGVLRQSIKIV